MVPFSVEPRNPDHVRGDHVLPGVHAALRAPGRGRDGAAHHRVGNPSVFGGRQMEKQAKVVHPTAG
jgi:hypothetical protein